MLPSGCVVSSQSREGPLAGVRVVSIEQYGAGPYGTMHLAALGAEVIKIERPGSGDIARQTSPHLLGDDDSLFFQTFNLSKRSLALDLQHPAGRSVLLKLIAGADALCSNLRGDLPAKLKLTHADLSDVNPAIVCAHLSAYGRTSSRAAWPGYDYLMQAEAGFLSVTGEPDGPPARFGLSMVDYMTGSMLAMGLLAGVIDARRTGVGRDIDVSLFDVALHQLSYPATWYLNEGTETTRLPRSAHPATVPSQLYRTSNGWIFIMAMTPKFWEKLVAIIGDVLGYDSSHPALATNDRFASVKGRREYREELTATLDALLSQKPVEEWLTALRGRVPVAPVLDVKDALRSSWVEESEMIQTVQHRTHRDVQVLGSPFRIDGERPAVAQGPALGGDTRAILSEAGMTKDEIDILISVGVIGADIE